MASVIHVEVDIDEFSDEAIIQAMKDRELTADGLMTEDEFVARARQLIRAGDKDGLFDHTSDYIKDKLGLAIP